MELGGGRGSKRASSAETCRPFLRREMVDGGGGTALMCARLTGLALSVCFLFGCAVVRRVNPFARSFGPVLGVRFSQSLREVEAQLPNGQPETSPYGADCWRVRNVSDDGIKYQSVIFEFTHRHGMQLAIAWFPKASSREVLERLHGTLGKPSESSAPGKWAARDLIASWRLGDGAAVSFDGPARRLALVGPFGKGLIRDIKLRQEDEPSL
jgi:hypothetical protein